MRHFRLELVHRRNLHDGRDEVVHEAIFSHGGIDDAVVNLSEGWTVTYPIATPGGF